MRLRALQQLEFFFELGRLHLLQVFFHALQPFFDLAEIADHEIEFDILDVAQRIDSPTCGMEWIIESAKHVGQRVDLRRWAA